MSENQLQCVLVEKNHQIVKTNPNEHHIHLICNWPVVQGHFTAVRKSDDDDKRATLELYPSVKSIE